jgi:hypothetical protein
VSSPDRPTFAETSTSGAYALVSPRPIERDSATSPSAEYACRRLRARGSRGPWSSQSDAPGTSTLSTAMTPPAPARTPKSVRPSVRRESLRSTPGSTGGRPTDQSHAIPGTDDRRSTLSPLPRT